MRRSFISIAFGVCITLLLLAFAFGADAMGHPNVARILLWQNELLQSVVGGLNVGTLANPVYEGTPLNGVAFILSIPFGFLIYSLAAYFGVRVWRPKGRQK